MDLPPIEESNASKKRFIYCAESGFFKHAIPATKGGNNNDFASLVSDHKALGMKSLDCGLILSTNAHIWGAIFPILNYGNIAQQNTYLEKLLDGKLISGHAITEPQAGSDLNALSMTAEIKNNIFILNGHKRFITNTPIADVMIVYASIESALTAFIIHADDNGVKFLDNPTVNGCITAPMGDIILDNCRIPLTRQLGKTGAGKIILQQALELERAFIFAGISGVMEWQLESIIEYSRQRIVNDRHLGKQQAISHKIAEMKLRLDTIKLWVNECARLKDNNKRISLTSAQTKLFASEAFLQSSLDSVHIMGGSGLLNDNPLLMPVNDALASRLFSGSSEIQKNIIAALLGTGEGFKAAGRNPKPL